eukprot:1128301-Prymnesium_polylepis.1
MRRSGGDAASFMSSRHSAFSSGNVWPSRDARASSASHAAMRATQSACCARATAASPSSTERLTLPPSSRGGAPAVGAPPLPRRSKRSLSIEVSGTTQPSDGSKAASHRMCRTGSVAHSRSVAASGDGAASSEPQLCWTARRHSCSSATPRRPTPRCDDGSSSRWKAARPSSSTRSRVTSWRARPHATAAQQSAASRTCGGAFCIAA